MEVFFQTGHNQCVSRKTPLPKRELEILARLKASRRSLDLPRRLFAKAAGLDSSIIVRLELGRMPLRFGVARAICNAHSINPEWLATGEGNPQYAFKTPITKEIKGNDNAVFSDIFESHILPTLPPPREHPMDSFARSMMVEFWSDAVGQAFDHVSRGDLIKLDRQISAVLLNVTGIAPDHPDIKPFREHLAAIAAECEERQSNTVNYKHSKNRPDHVLKEPLDKALQLHDTAGVSEITSLPELIELLHKFTAARGQKAKLAAKLGVKRQAVDQWLSKNAKPSAEKVFALLEWVKDQRKNSKQQ